MNKISNYRILIWSENPDELMKFYRDVLELEVAVELKLSNDYGYGLKIAGTNLLLFIGKHSDIKGKAKEPFRHMFNFYVNDVFAWYEKLKDRADTEIIAKPYRTPPSTDDNPKYVFTLLDPDGNCLQFMNP